MDDAKIFYETSQTMKHLNKEKFSSALKNAMLSVGNDLILNLE